MSSLDRLVQFLTERLETKLAEATSLVTPTLLFGYIVPQEGDYRIQGLAKKENDQLLVKTHLNAPAWLTLAEIPCCNLLQLKALTWDIQHVFQHISHEQGLANYCWCGFHEDQHLENDACCCEGMTWEECKQAVSSDPAIKRLYSKMLHQEKALHRVGHCSNPNGCGLSS